MFESLRPWRSHVWLVCLTEQGATLKLNRNEKGKTTGVLEAAACGKPTCMLLTGQHNSSSGVGGSCAQSAQQQGSVLDRHLYDDAFRAHVVELALHLGPAEVLLLGQTPPGSALEPPGICYYIVPGEQHAICLVRTHGVTARQ